MSLECEGCGATPGDLHGEDCPVYAAIRLRKAEIGKGGPMSWQDELNLQRELLAEIRDLLRERLPGRPWSDDIRAADVVNDQDAEIARLRAEVERLTRERDAWRFNAKEWRERAEQAERELSQIGYDLAARYQDEIARAEKERDKARQTVLDERMLVEALQGIVETQVEDLAAAESRERKLREALERFGDHLPGCAHFHDLHDHIYPLPECSCGFHAALAAPPEEVRL